jgi:hypothetical protein
VNSDQWVSILSPTIVVAAGTATTVYYRLASKAGREIRLLRGQLESALRYIHELLLAMASHGVPRRLIPRAPRELAQANVFDEWTRDDDGSNDE